MEEGDTDEGKGLEERPDTLENPELTEEMATKETMEATTAKTGQ